MDGLVSHELAHQWWGDLLTCREWSEAWLNEGFATYFEYVWREQAKGRDEADHELLADTDGYLAEARALPAAGRLPAVRRADSPLRRAPLRKGRARAAHAAARARRRTVLARHRPLRAASTPRARSRRAIWRAPSRTSPAAASRRCSTAGSPAPVTPSSRGAGAGTTSARSARWRWRRSRRSRRRRRCSSSRATVRFEIDGRARDERVAVREATHNFEFPLPARPTQVIFDPGDVLLKSIKLDKSGAALAAPARGGRAGRRPGAGGAGAGRSPRARQHRGARRARSARIGSGACAPPPPARSGARGATRRATRCIAAMGAPEPRVRRAIAAGLGEFAGDETAARALADWLRAGDPQRLRRGRAGAGARPHALAAGAGAPAAARRPPVVPGRDRQPRHRGAGQDRRRAGVPARSAAPGARRRLSLPGAPWSPRWPSSRAGPASRARRARRSRSGCATATSASASRRRWRWGASASPTRCPPSAARSAAELDGRTKRRMNDAIRDIEDGARPAEEARRLQDEVERLRGETAKLRERLDRLETRLGAAARPTPAAPPRPSAPAPSSRRRSRRRSAPFGAERVALEASRLQLGDDVAGDLAGAWRARRAASRWRPRPGDRRRRSARRSC